jgi:hypothetical protein
MGTDEYFCFDKELRNKRIKEFKKSKICRFKASERLVRYASLSNWVFTILSLSLIVTTLMKSYNIVPLREGEFLDFFQLVLSITILVVFQIIVSSDYSVRALRFHQCGMEISAEMRKLENICIEDTPNNKREDKIKRSINEYTSILKRYDNHKYVDYLVFALQEEDEKSGIKEFLLRWVLEIISYLPHIILLGITIIGIYLSFNFSQ